jgi:haloacid dehalogenase-like hydrolase
MAGTSLSTGYSRSSQWHAVAVRCAALVFDLDGTLVDSVPDLRAALNKMLGEMGRGELTADEVRRTPTSNLGAFVCATQHARSYKRGCGVKPNVHWLRGSMSVRPLSGSCFFSKGTGSAVTKTSRVGDTTASITCPPLVLPSRCPTTICVWSAGLP